MNKIEEHLDICMYLNTLYKDKNADYGDSFGNTYREYGPVMAAIRLEDKLQRFKRLIKSEAKVKNESIEDTLIDLANYAIMTVIEIRNKNGVVRGE